MKFSTIVLGLGLLLVTGSHHLVGQESPVGDWSIWAVGMEEEIAMTFTDGGTIRVDAQGDETLVGSYNADERQMVLDQFGTLRYEVHNDELRIFFAGLGNDHPFIAAFVGSSDVNRDNPVEARFFDAIVEALISTASQTPFMVGSRR